MKLHVEIISSIKNPNNKGFSLLELSITIAIVALIIGSITAGSNLMQAASINKAISEFSYYTKTVETFRLKYNAWPGDMATATTYWGTYNGATNVEGTANGDGNERIDNIATESLKAWQQLALSGTIIGHYTGQDAGTPDWQSGVNVPAASIYNLGNYILFYVSNYFGTSGNALWLSAVTLPNTDPWEGAVKPADAYLIDKKIDDGVASTGNIYAARSSALHATAGRCVSSDYDNASGDYVLTDNTLSCRMFEWLSKN